MLTRLRDAQAVATIISGHVWEGVSRGDQHLNQHIKERSSSSPLPVGIIPRAESPDGANPLSLLELGPAAPPAFRLWHFRLLGFQLQLRTSTSTADGSCGTFQWLLPCEPVPVINFLLYSCVYPVGSVSLENFNGKQNTLRPPWPHILCIPVVKTSHMAKPSSRREGDCRATGAAPSRGVTVMTCARLGRGLQKN